MRYLREIPCYWGHPQVIPWEIQSESPPAELTGRNRIQQRVWHLDISLHLIRKLDLISACTDVSPFNTQVHPFTEKTDGYCAAWLCHEELKCCQSHFLSHWKCWNGLGIPDYEYWEMVFSQWREHRDKKGVLCHFSAALPLPFLCSTVLQPSVGKPWSRVAQEPSPVLRDERENPPESPVPAAAWLCGWTCHTRQREEDICSMTQCRVLCAKTNKLTHAMPHGSAQLKLGSTITATLSYTNPKLRQFISTWGEFTMHSCT